MWCGLDLRPLCLGQPDVPARDVGHRKANPSPSAYDRAWHASGLGGLGSTLGEGRGSQTHRHQRRAHSLGQGNSAGGVAMDAQ